MALLAAFACTPQKKILYYQDKSGADSVIVSQDTLYMPVIQPNDILTIYVTSSSPDASRYFNFMESADDATSMANGYLVDASGNVQLPFVGNIHVAGLTSAVARDSISKKLEKYLINPSVKLSIRNFRVTVMGEVKSPGVYTAPNEQITLPEALALAGDLTVYGNREKITLVRVEEGKKMFIPIDLTNREIFKSEYYSLHCNDIIYVEPIRKKRFITENYYRVLPIIFGGVAAAFAVYNVTR